MHLIINAIPYFECFCKNELMIHFLMQQLSDEILQKIAKEMNLSDTGFILEKNNQDTYSKGLNIPVSLNYASGGSRGRVWEWGHLPPSLPQSCKKKGQIVIPQKRPIGQNQSPTQETSIFFSVQKLMFFLFFF